MFYMKISKLTLPVWINSWTTKIGTIQFLMIVIINVVWPATGLYSFVVGHMLDKHCRKAGDRVVTGARVVDWSGILTVVIGGPDVIGGLTLNIGRCGRCLCGRFCCQLFSKSCCICTSSGSTGKPKSPCGNDREIARIPAG